MKVLYRPRDEDRDIMNVYICSTLIHQPPTRILLMSLLGIIFNGIKILLVYRQADKNWFSLFALCIEDQIPFPYQQ